MRGALFTIPILFGLTVLHNFFVRNWTVGSAAPCRRYFPPMSFVVEAISFLPVPLTLTYCALTQCGLNDQT